MTPEQLALVRDSAAVIAASSDEFARRFYDRLFTLHPASRRLFHDDLRAQRGKLVDEITFLASAAADLAGFLERARDLGRRHQSYGVHAADYHFVGDALLDAAAHVVGPAWTTEAEEAWRRLYDLIAESMLEGAAGGLFTASP